jgi:uncharacterized protein (DUF3820 family)
MNTNIALNTEPGLKSRINRMKWKSRNSLRIPFIVIIILIMLKNPFIACTNINSAFYNKVLNDFDTTSYFIAVDIKSPFYKGRTIIENNNLYMYLHKTKGFDKGKYLYFMKRTLRHHRALRITDNDIIDWKFIKVTELESVINVADRGSDNFVANYFNGRVLNYGLTDKEQNAVINQLFYWEIPAKIDKQTGNLIIG